MAGTEDGEFAGWAGAALVVGGTGGIGAAVVRLLARRGSDVAVTWHGGEQVAAALAEEAAGYGGRVSSHHLDVTNAEECASVVAEVEARYSGVHTLVYAAGRPGTWTALGEEAPAVLAERLSAEAGGFVSVVRAALPALRASRGSVVAVTTAMTRRLLPRAGAGAASQAAIELAVRTLALEEGHLGVRANCVGAGLLHDAAADRLVERGDIDERGLELARAHVPLDRFGLDHDVAEAVCFLASPRAAFISGQKLDVDGGFGV